MIFYEAFARKPFDFAFSRRAAQENSPRFQPWGLKRKVTKPRQGRQKIAGQNPILSPLPGLLSFGNFTHG
ncbi:MAG TPA: hypothetical protein VHY30_08390 [Verrucomicrobiae bacterium]|nr:hypothetical protein [Verrucomicrobiae bacterium]